MSVTRSTAAVLMYHQLTPGTPADRYAVAASRFAEHMAALDQAGFRGVSLRDFLQGNFKERRPVVVTFDDGYDSDASLALPILRQHGFTATFFVTTARIDDPTRISSAQIRELAGEKMEIGCHGHTHQFMDGMSPEQLKSELDEPRRVLAGLLGGAPASMSFPGGRFSAAVLEAVWRAGYTAAGTSIPSRAASGPNPDRYVTGRYAMTRSLQSPTLLALARGDLLIRGRYRAVHAAAQGLKRALGVGLYHRLWRVASTASGGGSRVDS